MAKSIRVQRYIRDEAYYIIPTNKHNQFIGLCYDSRLDGIRFEIFKQKKNEPGNYLTPDVTKHFVLSREECEVYQKMISMTWNQNSKDSKTILNREFTVSNTGLNKISLILTKIQQKTILTTKSKYKPQTDLFNSFDFDLSYLLCKDIYGVIRHLL